MSEAVGDLLTMHRLTSVPIGLLFTSVSVDYLWVRAQLRWRSGRRLENSSASNESLWIMSPPRLGRTRTLTSLPSYCCARHVYGDLCPLQTRNVG